MKKNILFLLLLLVLFVFGSVLSIIAFQTPLYKSIDVFFYRGIAIIVLTGVVISFVLLILRHCFFKDVLLVRDAFSFFLVFCCVNILFFTHVPVTADRSISVFMLGYMADNEEKCFSEEEIEDYFIERYVKDNGAFAKRFHEQVETGTIEEVTPGKYQITESGVKLMKMYEKVAEIYGIDDKLIHSDE